jgi:carbon monoxide dehydrogenase subunit G
MTLVRTDIDIAVPPQVVWDVIMDPHRFGDWVTIHRRLDKADTGPLREGFEVSQWLALSGAPFKVRWRLAELDPPHRGVWEGRGPAGSRARIVNVLEGDERTHFDYLNEYAEPGGVMGRLAGRMLVGGLAEREAHRSLRRLKALLESSYRVQ